MSEANATDRHAYLSHTHSPLVSGPNPWSWSSGNAATGQTIDSLTRQIVPGSVKNRRTGTLI